MYYQYFAVLGLQAVQAERQNSLHSKLSTES